MHEVQLLILIVLLILFLVVIFLLILLFFGDLSWPFCCRSCLPFNLRLRPSNEVPQVPLQKGRKHGHGCSHDCLYTGSAPKKTPCPKCGKLGKRKRTCTREVRTVAFKAVAYLKITYGEYTAQCECCTTFRNTPEGVLPKDHYDNKVRDLVLDRIIKDGMSIERILESLRREFLLELSSGFVYNVLRDRAEELDMSEHRRKVLEHFSGTLGVDELHLGRCTLLLATDPLSDLPVAFALVAANDQDHMWQFLKNLKNWGLEPRVVVTDSSNFYPAAIAEFWSEADHQLRGLPRHQGHQQADSGCRAANEESHEQARQGRAEEEAGPQEPQGQGSSSPPRDDGQGESVLRIQASVFDREASGRLHRTGA